MMACVSSWLLCSVTLLLMLQGNSCECLNKEELVTEMSRDVESPSECVLTCTVLTYRQILNTQQRVTVRFRDSGSGESGDFCWFIHKRCSLWDEFFVLLPVHESAVDGETLRLQTNSLTHTELVPPHNATSLLPATCGLRFDVTPHVREQQHQTLCVTGFMGDRLQCAPYLVIIRNKHSKSENRP